MNANDIMRCAQFMTPREFKEFVSRQRESGRIEPEFTGVAQEAIARDVKEWMDEERDGAAQRVVDALRTEDVCP